jgi:antitoxin component of MazEF toxin-antitoxin module
MRDVVKKWRKKAAARLPVDVQDVQEEGGKIVVKPIHPARYDIDALVAGITENNRQDPIGTGQPVGAEIW